MQISELLDVVPLVARKCVVMHKFKDKQHLKNGGKASKSVSHWSKKMTRPLEHRSGL